MNGELHRKEVGNGDVECRHRRLSATSATRLPGGSGDAMILSPRKSVSPVLFETLMFCRLDNLRASNPADR